MYITLSRRSAQFLSTLSLRRATDLRFRCSRGSRNFYPRSPCGERLRNSSALCMYSIFLSTLSLRRATGHCSAAWLFSPYFYPRSPCGERRHHRGPGQGHKCISIHALLAESDPGGDQLAAHSQHFYPRSPCGERRVDNALRGIRNLEFLSTLSLRRATCPG